jgi:hypothetical protein
MGGSTGADDIGRQPIFTEILLQVAFQAEKSEWNLYARGS